MSGPSYSLKDLADKVKGELIGDPKVVISSIATIQNASSGCISFIANPKYKKYSKYSDNEYLKLRNQKVRNISRSGKLRAAYNAISRILKTSLNHHVLDLQAKKPQIYTIQERNYNEYIDIQIEGNIRKITHGVDLDNWKKIRLKPVIDDYLNHLNKVNVKSESVRILCHGARNGTEVEAFKYLLQENLPNNVQTQSRNEVLGTDVSPTAIDFDLIQHDFNLALPDHYGKFDIIYSTSLDQSQTPKKALGAWANSLSEDGKIYLEWTRGHGKLSSSVLDPFSCETELFPFACLQIFKGKIHVSNFLQFDENDNREGVFVLEAVKTW